MTTAILLDHLQDDHHLDLYSSSILVDSMSTKTPIEQDAIICLENQHLILNADSSSDMQDWDFWQQVVKDYPGVKNSSQRLSSKLRSGVPHAMRGLVWQSVAQSNSLHLDHLYEQLCKEEGGEYDLIIQRDLSRTFPQLEMFKDDGGEGQQAMGRLLRAYSVYDPPVGYCQGLAFLVGPLLLTMSDKEAFCVFVRLMETNEMRTMFTSNMEGLHRRLDHFKQLLPRRLERHLSKHGIQPAMYASQWYLTLFAYSFPLSLVLRIYDVVFSEGAIETVTRVAVALMQKNADTLLAMDDVEPLMKFLTSQKLFEVGFGSNADLVMAEAAALVLEDEQKRWMEESQAALVEKVMLLQGEKDALMEERDRLLEETEEVAQKALSAKKTCADLQLEKMGLEDENERLKREVKMLEDQRREYLMPRGSFTEEVFAAHESLFGKRPVETVVTDDEYQRKYMESELRCRELEKLLAETKFKLVEYEAGSEPLVSPRASLQQRRPMMQSKRSSLSMLCGSTSTGPLSPSLDSARESMDSVRSNNSSSTKRSSVYSRLLNALGTGSLPEETQDDQ